MNQECRTPEVGDVSWHVRCLTCRLHRDYGAASLTADVKATAHALTHTHHRVMIESHRVEWIKVPQAEIPLPDDEVPF